MTRSEGLEGSKHNKLARTIAVAALVAIVTLAVVSKKREKVFADLKAKNPDYNGKGRFMHDLERDGIMFHAGFDNAGLTDLNAFEGLNLDTLTCNDNRITDLSPLKGMPLKVLKVAGSPVGDLTPIKASPIEELSLPGSKVADYQQLLGMKLRKLWIDVGVPGSGMEALRKMETLPHINDQEVETFWRTYVESLREL